MLLVHEPEKQALNAVVYDQDFIGADKEVRFNHNSWLEQLNWGALDFRRQQN